MFKQISRLVDETVTDVNLTKLINFASVDISKAKSLQKYSVDELNSLSLIAHEIAVQRTNYNELIEKIKGAPTTKNGVQYV